MNDLALIGDGKTTFKKIWDQTQRWLEINLIGELIGDWKTSPKQFRFTTQEATSHWLLMADN